MKSSFQNNDTEIYSTHNQGKSVIAERFIRTLTIKFINSIIKMELVDIKTNTYIYSSKDTNDNDSKFKIGDIVRISKYKNIFAKGYTLNWSEEAFMIKRIKNTVPCTTLMKKKLLELFTKKNCITKNKSKRV